MPHHHINYLEIPVKDMTKTKTFFNRVFGWQFQDYGPQYSCFLDVGITGGFFESGNVFTTEKGAPLIVLYSSSLEKSQSSVIENGGRISKPIFKFPGGRRFQFLDTNGNEYAVWSE